jgi:hypothetical protein
MDEHYVAELLQMSNEREPTPARSARLQDIGDFCACALLVIASMGGMALVFDLISGFRWP